MTEALYTIFPQTYDYITHLVNIYLSIMTFIGTLFISYSITIHFYDIVRFRYLLCKNNIIRKMRISKRLYDRRKKKRTHYKRRLMYIKWVHELRDIPMDICRNVLYPYLV